MCVCVGWVGGYRVVVFGCAYTHNAMNICRSSEHVCVCVSEHVCVCVCIFGCAYRYVAMNTKS